MKPRSKTNGKQSAGQRTRPGQNARQATRGVEEMRRQGIRGYEQTMRTGQRVQQEAVRGWNSMLSQAGSPADWQRGVANMTVIAGNLMPMAQKQMQQTVELMTKNGRAGAELMRKAMEAAQSSNMAESQSRWMEVWTSSMRAFQSNAQAVTEIGARAIDSWVQFLRKNTETTQVKVPKGAS